MGKSKIIFRDITSQRIITSQEAAKRDPETWQEEVFAPTEPKEKPLKRSDMPFVQHLSG